jgi:predicted acetyltransferase
MSHAEDRSVDQSIKPEPSASVATPGVTLDAATPSNAELLANLLELYIHDLSDVFSGLEVGPDGRFGYRRLPLYWSQPDRRFPFLIRLEGRVAGFALVQRGSPLNPDANGLDVEEFFVLRQYRRAGVGRHAAELLWERFPGAWTVRVADDNRSALTFWRGVITEYTKRSATESLVLHDGRQWRVFSFASR